MPRGVLQPASALRVIADERHEDRRTLLEGLRKSVAPDIPAPEELRSIDDLLVAQSEGRPAALVILGDAGMAQRHDLDADMERLRSNGVPVVVAWDPRQTYTEQAPDVLHMVNGFAWRRGDPATELITFLKRLLGIDESTRRVFLSYRRNSSEGLAFQLRQYLIDSGWHVFVDQFNIDPTVDFQAALFRDLDGRSLVLLIEEPDTRESSWVDSEIAFANSHGIGISVVTPTAVRSSRFGKQQIIDVSTHMQTAEESKNRQMDAAEFPELVGKLQAAHTTSYRVRTQDLMSSAWGFLADAEYDVAPVDENLLVATAGAIQLVVGLTVSRPTIGDLSRIIEKANDMLLGDGDLRWLVYRIEDPDKEVRQAVETIGPACGVRCRNLKDFAREVPRGKR